MFCAEYFLEKGKLNRNCNLFLGCDSTSAFFGKGKCKALNFARKNDLFRDAFIELGQVIPPSEEMIEKLESYVCCLYGMEMETSVNNLRYVMFKGGKYGEETLPPNQDSLLQHIKRVNYECFIRRRCCEAHIGAPSPVGNGWIEEDGCLCIEWITIPPAPASILENVNCSCSKGCTSRRCGCIRAGVKCTEVCKCTGCKNCDEVEQFEDTFNNDFILSSDAESDDEL